MLYGGFFSAIGLTECDAHGFHFIAACLQVDHHCAGGQSVIEFLLTASMALAQAPMHVDTISAASLEQFRGMYQHSPLCAKAELTLWTREKKTRVFSLCSSPTASRTSGYLQYRASSAGKVTFVYPATKAPPFGLFKYATYGNGDASIEFTNQGYSYSLADSLRGNSLIEVAAVNGPGKPATITCGGNQTLQLNYTMRLMHEFGLDDRD